MGTYLQQNNLEITKTRGNLIKLLYQLLDPVDLDKVVPNITGFTDLTVSGMIGLLYRWIVKEHILSTGREKS